MNRTEWGRWLARFVVVAMLACGSPAMAQPAADLYQATTLVTGKREETRLPGFAEAFGRVLVKVSGDPRLSGDPGVAEMAREAASAVAEFSYRDRMEGIPVHDEQGSYDRPHDLTVRFDPAKVDAALRALGREPWLAPRPPVTVVLAVRHNDSGFMLAGDGKRNVDMRDSLAVAARGLGMTAILPKRAALAGAGLEPGRFAGPDLDQLAEQARGLADPALAGTLVWSDAALGWIARWRFEAGGGPVTWEVRGVNFDEAFRNGFRGAMQVLSGNGVPASAP